MYRKDNGHDACPTEFKMPAKVYKNRTVPFKVLAVLLYGKQPWIIRKSRTQRLVPTGELAKACHVSVGRLRDALEHLLRLDIVMSIQARPAHMVEVYLRPPLSPDWNDEDTALELIAPQDGGNAPTIDDKGQTNTEVAPT